MTARLNRRSQRLRFRVRCLIILDMQEILSRTDDSKAALRDQEFYELRLDDSNGSWESRYSVRESHAQWHEESGQVFWDEAETEILPTLEEAKERASFRDMQTILLHNKFDSFVASEIVQEEARNYKADVEKERTNYFANDARLSAQISQLGANRDSNDRYNRVDALAMQAGDNALQTSRRLRKIEHIHSELNRGGIKTISWTYGFAEDSINASFPWPRRLDVKLIETQDGETLAPTPRPSAWAYLSIILFPILGFFIPWGVIRAIGWMGAGFVTNPK
jgi:hypothetical protein